MEKTLVMELEERITMLEDQRSEQQIIIDALMAMIRKIREENGTF